MRSIEARSMRIKVPAPVYYYPYGAMESRNSAGIEVAPHDEEQRHLLTLEALAEIDAGEFIEHADVKAWAKSLSTREPMH
jgi:hypothetical protein